MAYKHLAVEMCDIYGPQYCNYCFTDMQTDIKYITLKNKQKTSPVSPKHSLHVEAY